MERTVKWPIFGLILVVCAGSGCSSHRQPSVEQGAASSYGETTTAITPVACSSINSLAETAIDSVQQYQGDVEMSYLVLGDGKVDPTHFLVMLMGTSGILIDWPVQMITNSSASPSIKNDCDTCAYSASQDALESLCEGFRLVLVDYPGIGGTTPADSLSAPDVTTALDAILHEIDGADGLSVKKVSVVGWSLGALMAMRYAADTSWSLDTVFPIAVMPGGSTVDENASGNSAPCVQTLWSNVCEVADTKREEPFGETLFELMFPLGSGTRDGCTASVDDKTGVVTFASGIELISCDSSSSNSIEAQCGDMWKVFKANRAEKIGDTTNPWFAGVRCDYEKTNVFEQERTFTSTYKYCYDGTLCTCNPDVQDLGSCTSGGVGICTASNPSYPTCASAEPLHAENLVVIYGSADLFIDPVYDVALANLYQGSQNVVKAEYSTGSGAGHGVMYQQPCWVQEQIYCSLTTCNSGTSFCPSSSDS